ncbi:MAG TPA: sigma factor-like helix-turn-helix DNA-binding protein [Candidatus Paceibacterota bacterium]
MIAVKTLKFKPGQVVKSLLIVVPERARDVIERRYGLFGNDSEGMTLEAIGDIYGITRERVRQIENFAMDTIKKSDAYNKAKPAFEDLEDYLISHGGVAKEERIISELASDKTNQNNIIFLLNVGESFVRFKEDDHLHHRWTTDENVAEKVGESLKGLHRSLTYDDLVTEAEMLERFAEHLRNNLEEYATEHASKWLGLSKQISSNPLGEWGLTDSPSIKTRGIRDYAYLVLRKHGEPLHFTEVASKISEMFDREAHVATCHNELIKDDRFVLVGRGLYALSEWGYTNGVVRDVIKNVLEKKGPLSKESIMSEVLKQRQVKENTVYVNLQNQKYFKKDLKGRYTLVS